MPVTAYSTSWKSELDVYQIMNKLTGSQNYSEHQIDRDLPDSWRAIIKSDLRCPCCFVPGAEIVSEAKSKTTGKVIRQAYFRFLNPKHHPLCDYSLNEEAKAKSENSVDFGAAKSNLTEVIRRLACAGMGCEIFSQEKIMEMRKWFLDKKASSQITITLDPETPTNVRKLLKSTRGGFLSRTPIAHLLTPEITSIPGFDYQIQARDLLIERYLNSLTVIKENRLFLYENEKKVTNLARRYHNQTVFDPTCLSEEYRKTQELTSFINANYAPLYKAQTNVIAMNNATALSALILFVSDWDMVSAISKFSTISLATEHADQTLGNVIGLNPFYDFEVWRELKLLQIYDIKFPNAFDPAKELTALESELKMRFHK